MLRIAANIRAVSWSRVGEDMGLWLHHRNSHGSKFMLVQLCRNNLDRDGLGAG